ncbi:restriction endonuclease [Actinomadura sp. ATCC 31491]|uniref:Restriction endonuclease n=1 Tax=Actinomadura luzonensis TaxID=2805427 RepID=A0ABT0FVN3_9ACTN|nr:restriction endonuclease [Actinomadura luzonensis]MCK2215968.1 restriction endonuclease [Actinomadura luzonensis]
MARGRGRRRIRDVRTAGVVAGAAGAAWLVAEHPVGTAVGAGVLAVLFVAGLIARQRVVQARRRLFVAANAELEKVDRLSGPEFEHLVAERLVTDGFRRVRVCGRAADGGVDITAVAPGGGRYAVQCKRYKGSVGAPAVRNFQGALANAFAGHTGVLVTSGRLTRQARLEALEARQPLVLLERDRLAEWLAGAWSLLPARAGPGAAEEDPA